MKYRSYLSAGVFALLMSTVICFADTGRQQITEDFMMILEENPELETLMKKSIDLAALHNPDPNTNPVQSLEDYYDFLGIYWMIRMYRIYTDVLIRALIISTISWISRFRNLQAKGYTILAWNIMNPLHHGANDMLQTGEHFFLLKKAGIMSTMNLSVLTNHLAWTKDGMRMKMSGQASMTGFPGNWQMKNRDRSLTQTSSLRLILRRRAFGRSMKTPNSRWAYS